MKGLITLCVCGLAMAAPALAQDRLPLGTRVGTEVAAPESTPSNSTYEEDGRRDPFVSLIATKKAANSARPARVKAGLSGLALADVSVKGIVRQGAVTLAVLEGPAGKSYVARSRDRLQDATVKAIDPEGVVFAQQVVDVTGEAHLRDVRKSLRQTTIEEDQ